jgi:hypothetical protein
LWHIACEPSAVGGTMSPDPLKKQESEDTMSEMSTPVRPTAADEKRALKILAKSVYRELKATGYGHSDIVGFTNELLDLVTAEMRESITPDA